MLGGETHPRDPPARRRIAASVFHKEEEMTSMLTRRRLARSGVAVAAAGPVAAVAACGGVGSSTASTSPQGEQNFVDPIVRVVETAKRKSPNASKDTLTEQSIRAHVERCVDVLSHKEPLLEHLVEKGKLKVVGAEYHLHSGKVELL